MTAITSPTLAEYLRSEARMLELELRKADASQQTATRLTPQGTPPGASTPIEPLEPGAIHVPLEIEGAIWSAQVEEVDDRRLQLVVNREAIVHGADRLQASIRYQPDNCRMQCSTGTIQSAGVISSDRVRVVFALT